MLASPSIAQVGVKPEVETEDGATRRGVIVGDARASGKGEERFKEFTGRSSGQQASKRRWEETERRGEAARRPSHHPRSRC